MVLKKRNPQNLKSIWGNLSTIVESEGGARKYRHKDYPLCHGTSCTRGSSVLHGNIPNGINISCLPRTFNCYDIMFFFRERKLIREHQRDDLDRAWLIFPQCKKETCHWFISHFAAFLLRYIFAVRFHMVKKIRLPITWTAFVTSQRVHIPHWNWFSVTDLEMNHQPLWLQCKWLIVLKDISFFSLMLIFLGLLA